ncbi:hypothetical protein, partial [Streptomyces sp. N35]|uniref:hypothetical protein n=1 Tax=Streptomyces sp. N35 TaxID=2795730 RepID=UPI0018F667A8
MNRITTTIVAAATAGALAIGVAPAAFASPAPNQTPTAASSPNTEVIPLSGAALEEAGISYEEAVRELEG